MKISLYNLLHRQFSLCTSDFENILDYKYLGPKHSNFLVHVFGVRNLAVFQCYRKSKK